MHDGHFIAIPRGPLIASAQATSNPRFPHLHAELATFVKSWRTPNLATPVPLDLQPVSSPWPLIPVTVGFQYFAMWREDVDLSMEGCSRLPLTYNLANSPAYEIS